MNVASHFPFANGENPGAHLDRVMARAFLENVPDLLYFKDRACRFIAVSRSKAARHGLEPADLAGKSDADFFSEKHAQRARADELGVIATGLPIIGKTEQLIWPDGRVSWAESSKLPLRDDDGEIIGTFGLSRDITEEKGIELQLEKTHRELVETSRQAGMSEIATGVLHNVGNVLNSLNISAGVIAAGLAQSKAESLAKVAALLGEHAGELGAFLSRDPRGQRIPEFFASHATHAIAERERLLAELASLQANVDHIKEIVTMQQAYATMVRVVEPLDAAALVEDALRMNAGALARHEVRVVLEFHTVPRVLAEKAKVLQILVNLIRNAKYAADEGRAPAKAITLRIEPGRAGFVRLVVQDNGIGIAPENLPKIFIHGFTTRAAGHGFGLHSARTAADEMGGTLTARSDGLGTGATFALELPIASERAPTEIAGVA
jgi:PAS domain S-box-containing protein